MRTVRLQMHVPERPAADVYRTLTDFARYPELSSAVRSVTVTEVDDLTSVSSWEVAFRAGILRWIEEDRFDRTALTITFAQVEGDIAVFDGSWECADVPGGSDIVFSARLDMGIPSLADALEPIAVRALTDNTLSIVAGLVGAVELIATEVGVPVGSPS
jgi:uncharacterized membrane protein